MNKRGQIYIVAALILSVVIFLLVSQTNFVREILIEDDFEQISQNFDIESAKFMNSLLAGDDDDISSDFDTFTKKFTDYVKVENPEFEFVFVIEYGVDKYAGYYIKKDIKIGPDTTLESNDPITGDVYQDDFSITLEITGEGKVRSVNDTSTITIEDIVYILNIDPGTPQIIIISREEKGEQTKVYLNEEFIEGRKVEVV